MKTSTLNKLAFSYILNAVESDGYDVNAYEVHTNQGKIDFVYKCFVSEYWYTEHKRYYKGNEMLAFESWLMGLPSCFNVDFQNYRIIEIAKEWGSLPAEASEKQEDKIINNWFHFIAVKFFQLKKQLENNSIKVDALVAA